jgi:hypothetical protein
VIGLIREHVERMRPPRALAVPFELGRPMGAPDEPAFQRKIMLALLDLFKAESGPVLTDFPDKPPGNAVDMEGWACPINLKTPPAGDDTATLQAALEDEIARLRPWYDEAVAARGRTTVGISGIEIEDIPALIAAFSRDLGMSSPDPDKTMPVLVKLATDDLKAFYYTAATAKPGRVADVALADWLWAETVAGRTMLALRKRCLDSEDPAINHLGERSLLPNHQRDKVG